MDKYNNPRYVRNLEAKLARATGALARATEALKGVKLMLDTELKDYHVEPWAERVCGALAFITTKPGGDHVDA